MNEIGENDRIILSINRTDVLNKISENYIEDRDFSEYVTYLKNKNSEGSVSNHVIIISRTIDTKKKVIEGAQIKDEIKQVTKFASVDLGGE